MFVASLDVGGGYDGCNDGGDGVGAYLGGVDDKIEGADDDAFSMLANLLTTALFDNDDGPEGAGC